MAERTRRRERNPEDAYRMNADTRHLFVNVCANILRREKTNTGIGFTSSPASPGFSKTHKCNRLVHYAGCNEVLVMINREKQIKAK
jgi:predicted GIY-YIG superfamily endonuclease